MFGGTMRGGRPRKRPFPGDLVIYPDTNVQSQNDGQMFRLGASEPGAPLFVRQPGTLSGGAQGGYQFTAQSPEVETSFSWTDLSGGMGLKFQQGGNDRRYWYADGIDCSIGGDIQSGPLINSITPSNRDSTNGISHYFVMHDTLYALNGRYVLVRAEVQTITQSGSAGTFTVTYNGNTSASVAWNATAAQLQAALQAVSGLEYVRVAKISQLYSILMRGAGNNPNQMTTTDSGGSSTSVATSATTDQAGGWSIDQDFGASAVATDVIVHKQNGGSVTYAYIALGDSANMYRYTPTSDDPATEYVQHASLTALAFGRAGRNLYRAHTTNKISMVDENADPWTAANWSADNTFFIGDANSAITRLTATAAGTLVIFKTDGIYVVDEEGEDVQLFPDLQFVPDSTNGKYFWHYENWLHVTYSGRHFRLDPTLTLEPIGPERYTSNDGPVRGFVTAGCGTAYAAYAGLYNSDTSTAHLLKFGAWPATTEGDPERIDAWHGDISPGSFGSGVKLTALFRTTIGAPTGHERLYIGTSDGKVHYFVLPCVPNPAACTDYDHDLTQSGTLFLPVWDGGFPGTIKFFRLTTASFAVPPASGVTVSLAEKSYQDDSYSTVETFSPTTSQTAWVGAVSVSATQFWPRLTFAYSAATVSARIKSLGITYQLRPPLVLMYEFRVLAENGLRLRDGRTLRIGADRIRTILRDWKDSNSGFQVYLPDESTYTNMLCVDYEEGMAWDDFTRQWRSAVKVRCLTESADGDLGGII